MDGLNGWGKCVLGIDPGMKGAIAFYYPDVPDMISAEDMPVAAGEVDAAALSRAIRLMSPMVAIVEQVASRPGQGVSSTFKFGMSFGAAKAVVAAMGVPMHLVTPNRWKKYFRLDSDKEKSRALAIRLWPASKHFARKMDDGRAEAALIARYGAETILHDGGV